FDFHPEAFLVPFVFVAMYAWERRSWRWFWLAIGASLSTLEMSGVALLALSLFWVLDGFRPRDVRSWLRQEHTKHAARVCVLVPDPWRVLVLTGARRSLYTCRNRYPSFVLPFLFYGAILGLTRVPRRPREVRPPNGTNDARIVIAPAQESRSLLILGAAAVA